MSYNACSSSLIIVTPVGKARENRDFKQDYLGTMILGLQTY